MSARGAHSVSPQRIAFAVIGVIFLASCRTGPEPVVIPVEDTSTFLGLAVVEASRVPDELVRADLYATIAGGYLATGAFQDALAVAQEGFLLVSESSESLEAIEIGLKLAPVLAATGDDQRVTEALETAVSFAARVDNSATEARLIPQIVTSGIGSGELARPLLRRAVDEVFVIEDPRLRAETLIDIGERYQESDANLSATNLIQQAIPAVRSIGESDVRAHLFARLAILAEESGETELSARLATNSVRELDEFPTDPDGERLVQTARLLSELGRHADASVLAEQLTDPAFAVRARTAAARFAPPVIARENLAAAERIVPEISDPAAFVRAEIELAGGFAHVGLAAMAITRAENAMGRLSIEPTLYSGVDLPSLLAELYVRLDRVELIRDLLLLGGDPYVRGAVAIAGADALAADTRFGVADDLYTIALIASDETTYLADALRQSIVRGFATTGSIRLAIRTVERMEDQLIRARAVAFLAATAEPGGNVTALYRADLASVLSTET